MTPGSFEADALSALRLAERGDFSVSRRLCRVDAAPEPAWVVGLRAQARLAGLDLGPLEGLDALRLEGSAGWFAATQLDRLSLLSLAESRPAWLERASGDPTDDVAAAGELTSLLRRAFQGEGASLVEAARALGARAMRGRLASVVVEAKAVEALALCEHDLSSSLQAARHASRMAQSEGLPQPQYTANLVLARVRRRTGHPHLALRILGALEQVAPPAWSGWLQWELFWAGAPGTQEIAAPARALLAAARAADLAGFDATRDRLRGRFAPMSPFGRDLARLVAVTDPRPGAETPETADWIHGREAELPAGLAALTGEDGPRAWVARAPGGPARRLLGPARPLWEAHAGPTVQLCSEERAAGRTGALLASLLFSGPGGVAEAELFARVYGFPYVRELHARVFGVLLHRVRKEVETIQIERVDGVCRATHDRAVCLPDPDASLQLEERLLRWIAREGRQEARRVAEELDVPLRSAQAVLQALVEDGALVRERAGRSFSYRVEDTTFQEPTSA